jgi:hypothetical protein
MTNQDISTYKAFWHYYVNEHRSRTNRNLHFLGTGLSFLWLVLAVSISPWFLLGAPFTGYGLAWVGHYYVEKNYPATFRYPFWSLAADLHMFAMMCAGRMEREVKRMGILADL